MCVPMGLFVRFQVGRCNLSAETVIAVNVGYYPTDSCRHPISVVDLYSNLNTLGETSHVPPRTFPDKQIQKKILRCPELGHQNAILKIPRVKKEKYLRTSP